MKEVHKLLGIERDATVDENGYPTQFAYAFGAAAEYEFIYEKGVAYVQGMKDGKIQAYATINLDVKGFVKSYTLL